MDIVKEIKAILALQDASEKDSKLSLLNDEFEYGHELNAADVVEGTQLLLAAALQEDDKVVKKKFFRTIDKAVLYQEIGNCINWGGLVVSLPSLEKSDLVYVLDLLGLSGQEDYLSLLDEYAHHSDPEIKKWANEAIEELKDRITHGTDSRRTG